MRRLWQGADRTVPYILLQFSAGGSGRGEVGFSSPSPQPPRSSSSRTGAPAVPRLVLGTLAASRVPRLAVTRRPRLSKRLVTRAALMVANGIATWLSFTEAEVRIQLSGIPPSPASICSFTATIPYSPCFSAYAIVTATGTSPFTALALGPQRNKGIRIRNSLFSGFRLKARASRPNEYCPRSDELGSAPRCEIDTNQVFVLVTTWYYGEAGLFLF